MKRIDIFYDREHYSVGGRDFEALRAEIAAGVASGVHWLKVNDGEGAPRPAYLLLSPGVPIAVIPIPEGAPDPDASDSDTWDGAGPAVRV